MRTSAAGSRSSTTKPARAPPSSPGSPRNSRGVQHGHELPARAQNAVSVLGRPSARCLRLPIRTAVRVHIQIAVSNRRGHWLWLLESDGAPASPGCRRRQAELPAGADYLTAPAIYAATIYVACRSRLPRPASRGSGTEGWEAAQGPDALPGIWLARA